MEIHLAYGGSELKVTLPDSAVVDQFAPMRSREASTYDEFLAEVKQSGAEHILSASSLLLVVNDGYRHTPTAQVLEWIDQAFPSALDRAHYLIATGTHKPPTENHYRSIFGRHLERVRVRIHSHVATNDESMLEVGVDSFGEAVLINRLLRQFESIVVIGSVEPHYFAGFTGGRKGIFPGLCDLATTTRNHNMANSLEAAPLRLSGNPVAEHLQSLLKLVADLQILSIQLVADISPRICAVCIGSLENSFTRAVTIATRMYAHTVSEPYDALLCEVLPPLDNNLYQVQKAVENCQAGVRENGALITVAACKEGIGSDYFFDEASKWDRVNNRPGDGVYRFGSHKLTRMAQHQRRIKVHLKSDLPDATVRTVFYHPVADVTEFLAKQLPSQARIAVVRDAAHTVLSTDHFTHTTNATQERVV